MEIIIYESADKLGKSTTIKHMVEEFEDTHNVMVIKSPNREIFSPEITDYYMKSGSSCQDYERQYYFTINEQHEFLKVIENKDDIDILLVDRLNIISSAIYRPLKTDADKMRYALSVESLKRYLTVLKDDITNIDVNIFVGEKPYVELDLTEEYEKNWHEKNQLYLEFYNSPVDPLMVICDELGITYEKTLVEVVN